MFSPTQNTKQLKFAGFGDFHQTLLWNVHKIMWPQTLCLSRWRKKKFNILNFLSFRGVCVAGIFFGDAEVTKAFVKASAASPAGVKNAWV